MKVGWLVALTVVMKVGETVAVTAVKRVLKMVVSKVWWTVEEKVAEKVERRAVVRDQWD